MIHEGHPPVEVWDYTPLQAHAFLFLGRTRRRHEMAEALHLHTLAARGEEKAVREALKRWTSG